MLKQLPKLPDSKLALEEITYLKPYTNYLIQCLEDFYLNEKTNGIQSARLRLLDEVLAFVRVIDRSIYVFRYAMSDGRHLTMSCSKHAQDLIQAVLVDDMVAAIKTSKKVSDGLEHDINVLTRMFTVLSQSNRPPKTTST